MGLQLIDRGTGGYGVFALPTELLADSCQARLELATEVTETYATDQGGTSCGRLFRESAVNQCRGTSEKSSDSVSPNHGAL
jgi:hypothetical protein